MLAGHAELSAEAIDIETRFLPPSTPEADH